MSTAMTKTETGFTDEKIGLVRRLVAVGATNDELAVFLHQCQRTGLDPLAKQIYCIKRQGKMAIQVGIDGFRLIADRTGLYAGNDDPVFDDEKHPKRATVTVYKMVSGVRCPFTASARWEQYYPGDGPSGFMWKKMPHLMLGKCAEALALRKAFPAELSGLYTDGEMEQAGPADPQHEAAPTITELAKALRAATTDAERRAAWAEVAKPETWRRLSGGERNNMRAVRDEVKRAAAYVAGVDDPALEHDTATRTA